MFRFAILLLLAVTSSTVAGSIGDIPPLLERGEYGEARDRLLALDDAAATEGPRLILLTRAFNGLGDHKQGVAYGKRAIELLPDSAEAHFQYAVALRVKMQKASRMSAMFTVGGYKGALKRAIELDPEHSEARMEEIGFLIEAPGIAGGSREQAQLRIDELKPISMRDGMLMQALLQTRQKDADGAMASYRKLLTLDEADHEARRALAFSLQTAGRYRAADEHFEKLLQQQDDPLMALGAHYQLARSRILGQYQAEKAVDYLLTYIEALPERAAGLPSSSHAHWRLGLAYQQMNRIDDARSALKTAVDLDKDNKEARQALSKLERR